MHVNSIYMKLTYYLHVKADVRQGITVIIYLFILQKLKPYVITKNHLIPSVRKVRLPTCALDRRYSIATFPEAPLFSYHGSTFGNLTRPDITIAVDWDVKHNFINLSS